MAHQDEQIEDADLIARGGDDSPPLMSKVPEPPPSHWGVLTSTPRTASPAYLRFLDSARKEAGRGHRE